MPIAANLSWQFPNLLQTTITPSAGPFASSNEHSPLGVLNHLLDPGIPPFGNIRLEGSIPVPSVASGIYANSST